MEMLSEALRLIRVYHDLKQSELADRLKISKSYLSEIESGAKSPTLALVDSYAEEFNIPPSAILFFAESIDDPSSAGRAREFVSRKILTLLRFIEERSEIKGGKRKSHLSS
jgi:transcriptional regulator with XRE-family HTH domain